MLTFSRNLSFSGERFGSCWGLCCIFGNPPPLYTFGVQGTGLAANPAVSPIVRAEPNITGRVPEAVVATNSDREEDLIEVEEGG